ncbi:MAG: Regulatory protein RecX [Pseudomonadota bacterium]|jgi:regulatory protein
MTSPELTPTRSGPSLKGRALRLLALREHTRSELEKKLARHEPDPDELRQALDELQAKGFICEQRVLESVLHSRAARLGTRRVRQELQAKGVSEQGLAEAVARLRDTELARAREVWRKKFGQLATEPKERARQARFLLARGFAGEVVRRVTQCEDVD